MAASCSWEKAEVVRAQLKSLRRLAVLRTRHASQGLVEYGLILASVGFLAMVGFNALGSAQAAYWGATTPQFAAPTPAPGDFIHPTNSTMTCDHRALLAGNSTLCTVTVTDQSQGSRRQAPTGTVLFVVDDGSTAGPCRLMPLMSSGNPPVASQCVINWQPSAADLAPWQASAGNNAPPPRHAQASYTPAANEAPSVSNQLTIQVQPALTVSIDPSAGCRAPWSPGSRTGAAWNVELGHPIACTLTVQDALAPTHPPVQGITMSWQHDASSGSPLFNCFTNNNYPALNACAPPSATGYTCTTDSTGACVVIFREDPANNGDAMAIPTAMRAIDLTASVYPTDIPTDNAATAQVKITPPRNDHPAGVIIDCARISGAVSFNSTSMLVPGRTAGRYVNTLSGVAVQGGPAVLTCTLVVFDASATANFDMSPPACNQSITNPDLSVTGDGCNPDDEDSYPPFGAVTLGSQSCSPSLSGHPTQLPLLIRGEPEYATSCTVTLNLPAAAKGTNVQYPVSYAGEAPYAGSSVPHTYANTPAFAMFTIDYD
jgi:hypothetical protein